MTNNYNVLVTGATGFIGQHLVRRLGELGCNINILARDSKKLQLAGLKIFEGNIFDYTLLKEAAKNAEIVFHLVSKTHDFSHNRNNANEYFRINVEGTRNLLNACIGSNVRHFVYFSSVKAMAEESENALDESSMPNPTTPYGKSKLEAEKLVAEYGGKYGFKTTSLRLPLVYGPGNKGNIYKMIKAVEKGLFVMVGRGHNRRSMVYVGNVVNAALTVVGRQKADHEIYIVTDGIDYSVKDLYGTIVKGLGKKPMPLCIPLCLAKTLACIGDFAGNIAGKPLPFNSNVLYKLTESFTLSCRKIQETMDFNPEHNLYNTINETIKWCLEN